MKVYYVLVARCAGEPWSVEFGDYDIDVVRDKEIALIGYDQTGIIACTDLQKDIDRMVSYLNAPINN